MVIPLSNIKPGDSCRVVFLGNEALMAGRLRDLGFEAGAVISCVLQRPRGNIAAFLVRGAVIALRVEDSRFVFVEPAEADDSSMCDSDCAARSRTDCEAIV